MSSEIPKDSASRSPLLQVHWERIVLDEGHIVRNSKTVAAHAVNAIEASHRWIVTGTPVHNRMSVIVENVCCVGVNHVGANHVFFMDLHWNPQLELQAQDRIHRYGQTKPVTVTVTRYIAANTVDERVAILQKEKLDLAEGILSNAKQKGAGLSLAQMATLFDL